MSLATMLWQTSANNSTWVDMKTPSAYKINWEDLDLDSYRSVVNGNLIRNVLSRRWAKVEMSWRLLSSNELNTILTAVNKDTVYFRFKSPAFGTNDWISFKGYVSKMNTELLEAQVGWNLAFNVVQMETATWQ